MHESEARDAKASPSSIEQAILAPYQASIFDDGVFVAGFAVYPESPARGWFVGYRGKGLKSARQLRIGLRWWREVMVDFNEVRAWVPCENPDAGRLAEWAGLKFDTGPATGISPIGRDMNLMLWRR